MVNEWQVGNLYLPGDLNCSTQSISSTSHHSFAQLSHDNGGSQKYDPDVHLEGSSANDLCQISCSRLF
jgi:hypothetical protein